MLWWERRELSLETTYLRRWMSAVVWLLRCGCCGVVDVVWLMRCGYCGVVDVVWLLWCGCCGVVVVV